MKILWTPRAASDLDHVMNYIGQESPTSAARVVDRIYSQIMKLAAFPEMGRVGQVPGTRELIFHPWSYIVVYRVAEDSIRILLVRHASQRWP